MVDVYAGHLVVNVSASWAEAHRDTVVSALQQALQPAGIAWHTDRAMLAQDRGIKQAHSTNGDTAHSEPAEQSALEAQQPEGNVVVQEDGVTFAVDLNSQKTGFYAGAPNSSFRSYPRARPV